MAANIQSTLLQFPAGPVVGPVLVGTSRDDIRKGYQVELFSVDAATTYSWQLSFTPESTGGGADPLEGTPSAAALLPPENATSQTARFNVDHEGAYLVRLVVDAGLPTENTQFVRMRFLTQFGDLKLVSAGERRDQNGVVPVDADSEGWSNDQNRNLQRLALFIRRTATSGRVLYVDANKGRDSANTPDDPDNLVDFPGWDPSNLVGTGMEAGAEGFGDFSSIGEAITYASNAVGRGEAVLSFAEPYVIFVKPGLYIEDLTLVPHVHIVGQGTVPKLLELQRYDAGLNLDFVSNNSVVVRTANSGGNTHTFLSTEPALNAVLLQDILLENTDAATTEPVLKHDGGLLLLDNTAILQRGNGATQGPALSSVTAGIIELPAIDGRDCTIWSQANVDADRYAVILDAPNANWKFRNSVFVGDGSCLKCNETLYGGLSAGDPRDSNITLEDCTLTAKEAAGYGLRAYATDNNFNRCTFTATDPTKAFSIDSFGAGAGAKGGDTNVVLDYSRVFGDIIFDTTSVALNSSVRFSTTHMSGTLSFPAGDPTTVDSGAHGKSLGYQQDYADPATGTPVLPVLSRLGVNNVQDAIDLLVQVLLPLGLAPHLSLESAYNGMASLNPPVVGGGLGKRIPADDGAVEITEASPPVGPSISALDQTNYNGFLKVEGGVDVGGLVTDGLGSEFSVDSNAFGAGPLVRMGRSVYADDSGGTLHRAINAGLLLGGSAANNNRYNMRMRTRDGSTSGTGTMGRTILEAGMSVAPNGGGAGPDGGDLYLKGGDYRNVAAGGFPGDVWMTPGFSDAGDPDARFKLVCPSAATPTSIEALNVFVGGQAGSAFFATPNGFQALVVLAGDTDAQVAAKVSLLEGLQGSLSVGKLVITTDLMGPNADVHYVGDDQGGLLNTALGELRVNSGAVLTQGTYPDFVGLYCAGPGVLGIDGVILGISTPTFNRQLITFADHIFTIPDSISILGVDSSGGALTVNLKSPTGAPDGTLLIINDEGGAAGANNITLDRCRIDGAYPVPGIAVNFGGVLLYSAGDSGTNAVGSVALASPGTAYTAGDTLTVTTGTGTSATIKVLTTTGGPGTPIATVEVLSAGNYTVDPAPLLAAATTGGSNDATFNLTMADVVDYFQVP